MANEKHPTDLELVNLVKKHACNDAITELIRRHKPLCIKIFNKYRAPLQDKSYFLDDYDNDVAVIFLKAILSFKEGKGSKFHSWLGNHARYHCLNIINKTKKLESIEDFKVEISTKDSNNDFLDFAFSIFDKLKDKRIKKIFENRYLNPPPETNWGNIAKNLGISKPTIERLHKFGISLLKAKISSRIVSDET